VKHLRTSGIINSIYVFASTDGAEYFGPDIKTLPAVCLMGESHKIKTKGNCFSVKSFFIDHHMFVTQVH
jgi:hypothetical protein